jgi:hypothetical protein
VTINYGSSTGAYNTRSDGREMDSSFTFQIGAFRPGFVPTPQNTAEWVEAWQPVSDAGGALADGATAGYDDSFLFPGGAGEYRVNSFSGVTVLAHNEAPFATGGAVDVWGFDNRLRAGQAEWVLLTDPLWAWPSAAGLSPALSFAVSATTEAVVGEVNAGAVEVRSAEVTVLPGPDFAAWTVSYFGTNDGPVSSPDADPDGDTRANLMEYYFGSNPTSTGPGAPLEVLASPDGQMFVTHSYDGASRGLRAELEWSLDLREWSPDGVTFAGSEDLAGTTVQALHTLTVDPSDRRPRYFRLRVTRD